MGRVGGVGGSDLHLDVFLRVEAVSPPRLLLLETRRPAARAVGVKEFVEGKLDGGADDAEAIGVVVGLGDALTVGHGVRDSGRGVEEGGGSKVVREERGEAEGDGVVQLFFVRVVLGGGQLAAALGEGLVLVVGCGVFRCC